MGEWLRIFEDGARWLRCWKVLVEKLWRNGDIEHRSGKHVVSDMTLNELMNACHTCGVWDRLKAGEIG